MSSARAHAVWLAEYALSPDTVSPLLSDTKMLEKSIFALPHSALG